MILLLNRDQFKAALAVLGLLALWGCAHRPRPAVNYLVGPECHVSAELRQCDHAEPPNCKTAAVKFIKGCERLEVKR